MDGDRVQYRCKFDAFVMPNQCYGAAVACAKGTVTATPTVAVADGKATVTSTEGVVYYTLDGSDPRYSVEAKTYTSAIALKSGDQLRAYASADGMFNSDVLEKNQA